MTDLIPLSAITDAPGVQAAPQAAPPGLITLDQIKDAPAPPPSAQSSAVKMPNTVGGNLDYVFGAAPINAALGEGDVLRQREILDNPFSYTEGPNPQLTDTAKEGLSAPKGAAAVNEALFGAPEVAAPNPVARYAGAVTGAVGANPIGAAIAPRFTTAGALGSEAGSDLNAANGSPVSDATARLIGGLGGGGIYGGGKVAGSVAGRIISPATEAAARTISPGALDEQTAGRVAKAMQADIDSGAVTPGDFEKAYANGIMPWEVENAENTRALAGAITRSGGPARTTMRAYAKEEDAAAPERITGAFSQGLGQGDINAATDELINAQKTQAAPLYEQAFQGGSTAPLEDQLRQSLIQATGAKGQIAKQIADIEQNNPGALAARGAAGATTRAKYMQLQQELAQAEKNRVDTLGMFQKAQSDASANAPGAVWNPRIQQFLDDPIMKQGLSRGLTIQRLESLAQGRPFNPTEYAITGTDEAGQPVVGGVPNMRLLDAGKRGLDAIIQGERNPLTGKLSEYGRAVDMVRRSYLNELDDINPLYAQARAAYSGPARSLDAITSGKAALNSTPAEIRQELSGLSPGDQQLYRLSAMQEAVGPKINGGSLGSNEAARVLANTPERLKPQLEALFPDQASRDAALAAAQKANLKFQANRSAISGGSQTAERLADQTGEHAAIGPIGHAIGTIGALKTGEPFVAMSFGQRLINDLIGNKLSVSPALNARVAEMLTGKVPLDPALARLQAKGAIPPSASAPAIASALLAPRLAPAPQ